MQVCVVGTGYVGLVTGSCLAHIGHSVVCVDNNAAKVAQMQVGGVPIYEPGLAEIMQGAMQQGRLHFTTDLAMGVNHAEVIFIAVGTPALATGESDTRFVGAAARGIGDCWTGGYKVIVNKSTVPIGSGDWVRQLVLDAAAERAAETGKTLELEFDVVSNPEFLREGSAVYDTFNPDRIVLGGSSDRAIALMMQLYAPIISRQYAAANHASMQSPVPVVTTDITSAEMIKYAANAFLATKISFINEIANICDRVGADVQQVAQGIGLDSRIGRSFLNAGLGWGGSCFPKDVSALVHTAQNYGYEPELLQATIHTNQQQRLVVIEKLQQILKILKGKTIGLLGLTFKPNTDDMRDAPSLVIAAALLRLGAKVQAYDPMYETQRPVGLPEGVQLVADAAQVAENADALVLLTEWAAFQSLDYAGLAERMRSPLLIDGRNFLDANQLVAAGFSYLGIGRPTCISPKFVSPIPAIRGSAIPLSALQVASVA
jgi:UDPglucose 6-dehydrogenase